MAAQAAGTGFAASDDAAFQDLIDAHILGSGNNLAGIKPSTLNFTTNCWATLDLQRFTEANETADETAKLSYIGNALRPVLPSTAAGASLILLNEYWGAITQLNSTEAVLAGAVGSCNATGGFVTPELDFSANCSATGDFWWHNVLNTTLPQSAEAGASWLPLFKSSLGQPYNAMSDSTITAIYEGARSKNLTENGVLPTNLQAALVAAASGCSVSACGALSYGGNADIAGAGAVVAYGFIAGVSTLLTTTVGYFKINRKEGNEALRKSVISAAVAFWDTVVWFGVLACIAGIIYATSKVQTLYEFVICLLVVNLICNSMFLLLILYSRKVENMEESIRSWSRLIPQAFVFLSMYAVTLQTLIGKGQADKPWGSISWTYADLQDMPCYAAGLWPMSYLQEAAALQALLLLSPVLMALLLFLVARIEKSGILGDSWLLRQLQKGADYLDFDENGSVVVVLLAGAIVWVDFAYIVQVRDRARADFGSTYQDDAFGYGQIIAAGIAIQAIYAYFWGVSSYRYKSWREKRWAAKRLAAYNASRNSPPEVLPSATANKEATQISEQVAEANDARPDDRNSRDATV